MAATSTRRGTVMWLVLVAVMLLSFAAYSFAEVMLAERTAAWAMARNLELRCLAESGVEATAALLDEQARREVEPPGWFHDEKLFARVPLETSTQGRGWYSIVSSAAMLRDNTGWGNSVSTSVHSAIRYGLSDESAKLNLNTLPLGKQQRKLARTRLLALPGMTRQTADAILDWMDSDDDPSEFGAETAYYAAQQPAYRPKQSRLECLDELLLVRGVTRELLYGEDANGNGVLDANENDGSRSDPPDNADGLLQRGWLDFMTMVSAECNLRPDGSAKINVNHPNLVELFDVLQREFGTDVARFIVAWRLTG
ncbi:MAG TPA: hypothetical protein VK137_18485, partial [Planctomycetaceae bacterium]|nr:hypothetical protein [Planctomycetaceae bacterium]